MKRNLWKIVSFMLCACLVFGALAACGDEKTTSDNENVEFALTFVGGEGATGTAPTMADKAEGAKFKLPANTFVKEGFTFSKWSDGIKEYDAGATYTMPSKAVTFTAVWTMNPPPAGTTYTVNFALGEHAAADATAPAAMADKEFNSVINMPAAPAAATGWEFVGWETAGVVYELDATYTVRGNVTFTATWREVAPVVGYTITFMNGSVVYTTVQTNADGWIKQSNRPASPTKAHATFKHWSLTEDGEALDLGVKYFDANTTVYAVWDEETSYTVTFHPGNFSASGETPGDMVVYVGDKVTFPENPWTLAHNTFAGYVVQKESAPGAADWTNISDTVYKAGDTYTVTAENIRIKGTWTANTITVEFDANGGTGEMTKATFTFGSNFTIPECTFTAPEGKQFAGWAFADGTVIDRNPIGKSKYQAFVSAEDSLVIKATWEDIVLPSATFTEMIGKWTNGSNVAVVSTVGEGEGLLGSVIYNGTTMIYVYEYDGVYYGYDYTYASAYVVSCDGITLTITKDEEAFFSATEKAALSNASKTSFIGGWRIDDTNRIIFVDSDNGNSAYRSVSMATLTFTTADEYAVFSFESLSVVYTYLVKKVDNQLVGVYFGDPEKTAEAVTFNRGGVYSITITGEGKINQLVLAGNAPDASKLVAAEAPEGQKFDHWALTGSSVVFDETAVMDGNVHITPVYVADNTSSEEEGDVFTGNYEMANVGTIVKVIVTDYDAKTVVVELSDGTRVDMTYNSLGTPSWVEGAGKTVDLYFYCNIPAGLISKTVGIALSTDRTELYWVDCDSDAVLATFTLTE